MDDLTRKIQEQSKLRYQLTQKRKNNLPPLLRIGEYHPESGKYRVIFPNGGETISGIKLFNSSTSNGTPVRSTQAYGAQSISLDYKNYTEIEITEEEEEEKYPVAILYSVGNEIYVGGDRPIPKLVWQMPENTVDKKLSKFITNLGNRKINASIKYSLPSIASIPNYYIRQIIINKPDIEYLLNYKTDQNTLYSKIAYYAGNSTFVGMTRGLPLLGDNDAYIPLNPGLFFNYNSSFQEIPGTFPNRATTDGYMSDIVEVDSLSLTPDFFGAGQADCFLIDKNGEHKTTMPLSIVRTVEPPSDERSINRFEL
ncbi:hypothetical protein, partial [Anabaena sp. PCC 7108]